MEGNVRQLREELEKQDLFMKSKFKNVKKMKLLWRVSKFHCYKSEIYISPDSYSWFSVCIATNIEGRLIFLYFISDLEPDLAKSS